LTLECKESHAQAKTFLTASLKFGATSASNVRSLYKTRAHGKKVDKSLRDSDFLCNPSMDGIVFSQDKVEYDEGTELRSNFGIAPVKIGSGKGRRHCEIIEY
jgi:hypothetical protein